MASGSSGLSLFLTVLPRLASPGVLLPGPSVDGHWAWNNGVGDEGVDAVVIDDVEDLRDEGHVASSPEGKASHTERVAVGLQVRYPCKGCGPSDL